MAEVCVVGAGPAGALLARSLASRGHEVVVLEAGPAFDRETRRERTRRQLRPGTEDVWGMGGERDAYTTSGSCDWPVNRRRVKGVGGTTLRWAGVAPRLRPQDFEMASRYGVGRDWPIGYDDLRPHYLRAERALGVAGDGAAPFQPPRENPYPEPPLAPSHSDGLFAEAGDDVGVTVHPVPVACGPAGHTDGGARSRVRPPDARYTAAVDARRAVASGATLIDRAPVQRLEHGPDGERVTAAVYRTPDGEVSRQTADVFVAACGTYETPRLLLHSSSPHHPDGLANASGTVGRYLMGHPPAAVVGVLDEPTRQREVGAITAGCDQFYDGGGDRGSISLTFRNDAGPTPPELATAADCWGDRLLEEVSFHHGNAVGVSIRVESLPRAGNRIALDDSVTDDRGVPVPDVRFEPGQFAAAAQERAIAVGTDLVEALEGAVVHAGGTATGDELPQSGAGGYHPLGGARMGTDPDESVVDPTLRTHDLDNLYVTGGSPFVTAGGAPPVLTIAALALRAADHIHERWS